MSLQTIRQFARRLGRTLAHDEKSVVLQCTALSFLHRHVTPIRELRDVEFSGFSQWGEDGIIDWLVERLDGIPRTFVEFGVEDYWEANTRLLLHLRNWSGLVMDGSSANIASIRSQAISWRHSLSAVHAFIDRDNINSLIAGAGFSGEIGILSIDIDGNDYWVWEAINVVSPAIVVCEYNAVFGDLHSISIPYQPSFRRNRAHHSNLYFGASLPALVELGGRKGYDFIGTNSNGCNAFFVRRDCAARLASHLGSVRAYPSRFREERSADGRLALAPLSQRRHVIAQLPVHHFATGSTVKLSELGELYSHDWSAG